MNKCTIFCNLSPFLGSCITYLMNLRTVALRAYWCHGKKLHNLTIYLFICGLFDVSTIIGCRGKNDLEGMYKEAVMA